MNERLGISVGSLTLSLIGVFGIGVFLDMTPKGISVNQEIKYIPWKLGKDMVYLEQIAEDSMSDCWSSFWWYFRQLDNVRWAITQVVQHDT